jgi:hypothetical protein
VCFNLEVQPGKQDSFGYATLVSAIQARFLRAAHVLVWRLTEFLAAATSSQPSQSDRHGLSAQGRELDELLCSPQLHRCLTLVTAVLILGFVDSYSGSGGRSGGSRSQRAASFISTARPASVQRLTAPGSAQPVAAIVAGGPSLAVSPMSSRLFDLLGVDPAAVQYAARQKLLIENPLLDINAISNLYDVLLNLPEVSVTQCTHSVRPMPQAAT